MSDDMTIVQFLRASGEHWDEDRYTAGADRIEALEAAVKSMLHFNGDCACTACVAAHAILREGK
jgi:hypothetical protein